MSGEEILCFFEICGVRSRDLRFSKQAALTTAPEPPQGANDSGIYDILNCVKLPVYVMLYYVEHTQHAYKNVTTWVKHNLEESPMST